MEELSILQFIISLRYIITVEPIFLTFLASLALQQPLLQQFLYDYVSKTYNFTQTLSNDLCAPNTTSSSNDSLFFGFDEPNSELTDLENKVQARTSYILLLLNTTNTIPSVLVSVMYGAWTDKVGRKPLLIISLIGVVIQNMSVVCVANFDLPYYLLFIGSAIAGITGSFSCVLLCGFAYISDITDSKNRAFRIGVLEAMVYAGATVSFFVSGVWVKTSGGYKQPFWGAFGMALFALLYTIIVLPESKGQTLVQPATQVNPFKCTSVKNMIDMLKQRPILCVGLVAFLLIVFGVFNQIIIIYLKAHPLCFSTVLVGIWYGIQVSTKAVGLVIGTKIFQRFFSDPVMILIGVISWIANCIMVALAKSSLVLFLSLIPGVFQALSTAGTRTVLSKLARKDKQGLIFSAVGMIEALASFLAPLVYNTVYPFSRSVLHFPPFCFYITAGILTLSIPLVVLVYYKGVLPMKYRSFTDSGIDSFAEDNDSQCIEEEFFKAVNN